MHTIERTDLDGDALTIHRDKGLAWVTVTRDEKELTVGPVPADVLEPLGAYVRHEKHGVADRIEQAADRLVAFMNRDQAPVRECPDPEQHEAVHYYDGKDAEAWREMYLDTTSRAEKAEKERGEARQELADLRRRYNEQGDALVASYAQPRPLTPDDITDEMIERAAVASARDTDARPLHDLRPNTQARIRRRMRVVLAAALTVPTRPEGAEGIESQIEAWDHEYGDDAIMTAPRLRELADFLASRGVRVEGSGR